MLIVNTGLKQVRDAAKCAIALMQLKGASQVKPNQGAVAGKTIKKILIVQS